eukprot:219128-Amorphochlora_amoeboformis.AAC.1
MYETRPIVIASELEVDNEEPVATYVEMVPQGSEEFIPEGKVVDVVQDAKLRTAPKKIVEKKAPKPPTAYEKAIYQRPLAKHQPDIYKSSTPTQDIYSKPRAEIYKNDLRPPGVDIYSSPYENYRPTNIYNNPYHGTRSIYKSSTSSKVLYDQQHPEVAKTLNISPPS